jgi:hypothetical protein
MREEIITYVLIILFVIMCAQCCRVARWSKLLKAGWYPAQISCQNVPAQIHYQVVASICVTFMYALGLYKVYILFIYHLCQE